MKHIIFGESVAGSMKFAFKKEKAKIIAFPDYLGEGPIQELLTTEGLNQRSAWLEQAFGQYTTTDMMEQVLDVSKGFGGGEVLESDFLLVFANDKKKLSAVTLSRKYGDNSVQDNRYLIVGKRQ